MGCSCAKPETPFSVRVATHSGVIRLVGDHLPSDTAAALHESVAAEFDVKATSVQLLLRGVLLGPDAMKHKLRDLQIVQGTPITLAFAHQFTGQLRGKASLESFVLPFMGGDPTNGTVEARLRPDDGTFEGILASAQEKDPYVSECSVFEGTEARNRILEYIDECKERLLKSGASDDMGNLDLMKNFLSSAGLCQCVISIWGGFGIDGGTKEHRCEALMAGHRLTVTQKIFYPGYK